MESTSSLSSQSSAVASSGPDHACARSTSLFGRVLIMCTPRCHQTVQGICAGTGITQGWLPTKAGLASPLFRTDESVFRFHLWALACRSHKIMHRHRQLKSTYHDHVVDATNTSNGSHVWQCSMRVTTRLRGLTKAHHLPGYSCEASHRLRVFT